MREIHNIVLIVPNFRWRDIDSITYWHFVPYNLCMIAAMIESDYNVTIIDANLNNYSHQAFQKIISEHQPDLVGITVLMDHYGITGHIAAQLVKELNQNVKVVIGGVYASTNEEYVMRDEHIDLLIAGEGEYAFRDLLEYLNGERDRMPKGIWYRDNGQIIPGGRTDLIEKLDLLPFPAYHLIDFKRYSTHIERNSVDRPPSMPYAWIFTSRGCKLNCAFCQVKYIAGSRFRGRSAENVLAEIRWLKDEYGISSFLIFDDNFFTDRERVKKILQGLIDGDYRLKWKIGAAALFYLDEEILILMKRSGCEYIDIAIESGCERVLKDIIHKPVRKEKVIEIVKIVKELGIFIAANFIIGFPGETWDEIRETLKFAEDVDVDYAKIFFPVPLPHTQVYKAAEDLNSLPANYDSKNNDWKHAIIQTDQFSRRDISILRAYEWDRINFTKPSKREKIAEIMQISGEELLMIRRNTLNTLQIEGEKCE